MNGNGTRFDRGKAASGRQQSGHDKRWSRVYGGALVAAVVFHAAVLGFWPQKEISYREVLRGSPTPMIDPSLMMRTVEIPPPPAEIRIPAPGYLTEPLFDLGDEMPEITMPEFQDVWRFELPEPPLRAETDEYADYLPFTPAMVRPEITNRREVERFLSHRYQPLYRATRVVGVVQVLFWIDEEGITQHAAVAASSGLDLLDKLAIELSRIVTFRPAVYRGETVPVRVMLPVRFQHGGGV